MKIALGVEYDGSGFHGWQVQDGVRTIQQELEKAVSRVAAHPVRLFCAGRTDTGVHALGQVVHFDTAACREDWQWQKGINVNLPADISVKWVRNLGDSDFHARFSAMSRSYRYFIWNREARSSLLSRRVNWVYHLLDHEAMQEGAGFLVGTHDFSSYRAVQCQAKSPVKTIEYLQIERHGDMVILSVKANAFLHHMVRNIAGVLIAVGKGDQPASWVREVLDLRDRRLGGVTAVPDGLYLGNVDYPEEYGIPETDYSVLSWC